MYNISHILIGPPSSGKSSFANYLLNLDKNYRVVSTDKIRKELFGDESIQGDWQQIEAEVLDQIKHHLAAGNPIIYDATNAKRPWRMELLAKIKQDDEINWLGWHLKTPLAVCKTWNLKRERQVSEEVIESMYDSLKKFPPLAAEGFTAVYEIPYEENCLNTKNTLERIANLPRNLTNRQNRTQNRQIKLHSYSRLLDFDRLMHLISLIIHYPGVGNLQETDSQLFKEIFGEEVKFENSLDEVCALLQKKSAAIYADRQAVQKDLEWLESNGILGSHQTNSEIKLIESEYPDLVTHSYSEIEPFERLIKIIRFIIHHPFLYNRDLGSLESLITEMEARQQLDFNRANSVRKDIEKVLKPFRILPNFAMKRGYFTGTGILSEQDLTKVFRLLEAHANSLEDSISLEVYQKFRDRMSYANLSRPEGYQVRAIYNRTIVDLETLPSDALARRTDELERAIEEGGLLELNRIRGGGRFSSEPDQFFRVFPLQIVFHNIGWYLGFEYADGKQSGLLSFERLDRLFLGQEQYQKRDRSEQETSLNRLIALYQSCGGIFLGNNLEAQRCYLSKDKSQKAKVEVTIELWFNDEMFRFVSEGTKRFPLNQMRMSPKLDQNNQKNKVPFTLRRTENPEFRNRFEVTLPNWCLEDVDLLRWIVGFGGQVKVVNPPELVDRVKTIGQAIAHLYDEI